jgi:hypothetical protein
MGIVISGRYFYKAESIFRDWFLLIAMRRQLKVSMKISSKLKGGRAGIRMGSLVSVSTMKLRNGRR